MTQIISDLLLAQERAMQEGNWIEPLIPLLRNVSAEQAYSKRSPDEHSIAEIVAHLAIWAEWAAGFLGGIDVDVEEWPHIEPEIDDRWDLLRQRLVDSYASLARATQYLSVEDLEVKPVPEVTQMTRLQAILSITMHAAYHSGQIVKMVEAPVTTEGSGTLN